MDLTQKQELYISRYMRSVADVLAGRLSDKQCDRALSRLHARIMDQIGAVDKARPEDVDVLDVLRKMGAPEKQADILARVWGGESTRPAAAPEPAATPASPAAAPVHDAASKPDTPRMSAEPSVTPASDTVWLGVFSWTATQLDWPVWALRILAVLVGLVTLPLALVAYMVAYFFLVAGGRMAACGPLHPWRMFFRPTMTVVMLTVIHFAARYAIRGVEIAHTVWLNRALPDMGEWAWFEAEGVRMYFWAVVLLVPIALFSAMPLANAWDYSLKRFTQACTALYAIVVSFGVASFVVGVILAFVKEFTGG